MPTHDDEVAALRRFEEAMGVNFSGVVHRDKPDFVISYQGYKTGVEITSGSAEEFRRALYIGKAAGLTGLSVSGLRERRENERLSNAELLGELQSVECVSSEDFAVHWAERIVKRIRTKVRLMQRGEIERFEKNWLCIVNEQADDGALDIDFYRAVLMGALGSDHSYRQAFDLIYIISGRRVFILDERRLIAAPMKKSANQAAEPIRTPVTPPAGAGDRASGAHGSP
ncbi:MAG: hypothetical protein ABSG50_15785 [Opitutaceae bacterium]|jgi:hypothetical protein